MYLRTGPALGHRPRVRRPRAHVGRGAKKKLSWGVYIEIFGFWGVYIAKFSEKA